MLMVLSGLLTVGAHPARADTPPIKLDVKLDLGADGLLAVTSTITVPEGATAEGRLPLSVPVEGNRTQNFEVSDIATTGGASTAVDADALSISAPAGESSVTYSVRGTVADGDDLQQFTWLLAAGWSAPIETLTGSFTSPTAEPDSPICAYGEIGVRRLCSLTQTDSRGSVTFQNNNLDTDNVAVFSVLLPAGTATATAEFTATVDAVGPSAVRDTAGLIAVAAAIAVALLLIGLAWLRRRADEAAGRTPGQSPELLANHQGGVAFASPDGVLPGQIGTLTTGRARPSDFGATILDLAVRNYLWVAEVAGPDGASDFQISRRAELDNAVTAFERAAVGAILPGDRESVAVAELVQSPRPVDLQTTRAAITSSLVTGGWLRRRHRAEMVGFALLGLGAVAAVVLAFAGTGVLWGVALAVLGAGLASAGRLLPSRTTSGTRLAAAIGGMRPYLTGLNPESVAPPARPVLFQRAIPYAHALGELRIWLGQWGTGDPGALDWYRALDDRPPLAGVATFAAVLDGVAAQSEAAEER
jgi:hypothetical protein